MKIKLKDFTIGNDKRFTLLAGPCVVESRDLVMRTAERIKEITERLGIPFVFKSSYKKANRTSVNSFTGLEFEEALKILEEVKKNFDLPIVTDIHLPSEAAKVAEVADILQIPAFLCRQTDLLTAAGETGKIVNIKKGQFLAPWDMKHAAEKVEATGNKNILLTERGTTFGYGNLVVDMRGLIMMKELGYPVVMDATHSVQMPGQGNVTGGQPEYIKPLAKAAVSIGIAALFMEVHPNPKNALSDAASQLPLEQLEDTLAEILKIDDVVKEER